MRHRVAGKFLAREYMQIENHPSRIDPDSKLGRLLKSTPFNLVIGTVIIVNMIVIGVESDFAPRSPESDSGAICLSALDSIRVCERYSSDIS